MSERSATRRKWVWNNHKHVCHWCGKRLGWAGENAMTVDHLVPRSRGGDNRRKNLVPACYECNQAKASMTPEDYAKVMEVALDSPR